MAPDFPLQIHFRTKETNTLTSLHLREQLCFATTSLTYIYAGPTPQATTLTDDRMHATRTLYLMPIKNNLIYSLNINNSSLLV